MTVSYRIETVSIRLSSIGTDMAALGDICGRERLPSLFGLLGLSALAWLYLLYMGWGMNHMDVGAQMLLMPRMNNWNGTDLALVFLMWAVMMVAMMLPTVLPMVMAFRSWGAPGARPAPALRVVAFVGGYLAVWVGFSALATLAQWGLLLTHWVTPMMEAGNPALSGALLLAAGIYQFTPLKRACLTACRSPLSFLLNENRPGRFGAWVMGLRHGLLCTGCCWLLMLLLFVLGVMNIAWIVALMLFVLIEKSWPDLRWWNQISGTLLMVWGIVLIGQLLVWS
jgi:predicted metal-binding membrane protein